MLDFFQGLLIERSKPCFLDFARPKLNIVAITVLLTSLSACGGGSGGGSGEGSVEGESSPASPVVNPVLADAFQSVTISGELTYDLVPQTDAGPLDYSSMTREPIKGATVRLLNGSDEVVFETESDVDGQYLLTGEPNTDYRVQVLAELFRSGQPSWDITVTDNTENFSVYALEGDLVSSGASDSVRDLHAASGWDGNSYSGTRAAGPFAILDSSFQALQSVLDADSQIGLPEVQLGWSIRNRPAQGNLEEGDIGTSFFSPSEGSIYILGAEDEDTDEYDRSVVQHEFMHYLEDAISRSDSLGGPHGFNQRLDLRVAYSESLANAFAGYVSGTANYSDSIGLRQQALPTEEMPAGSFGFSLETLSNFSMRGWFNERSVGNVIFDIADAPAGDDDGLSLGFTPILLAMKSPSFISSDVFTSIFLLREELERGLTNDADVQALRELMESQLIFGEDRFGTNEINSGGFTTDDGIDFSLPIYESVSLGSDVEVCTGNFFGEFNTLDNRRFVRFNVQNTTTVNIQISSTVNSDIDGQLIGVLFSQGYIVDFYVANDSGIIDVDERLSEGNYILEVFDQQNVDQLVTSGGFACFQVALSEQ